MRLPFRWVGRFCGMFLIGCCLSAVAQEQSSSLDRWLGPQSWEKDTTAPIVSLGKDGEFDDRHIFAPTVAEEGGVFRMWYSGSRGNPGNRVFRLGLATSSD